MDNYVWNKSSLDVSGKMREKLWWKASLELEYCSLRHINSIHLGKEPVRWAPCSPPQLRSCYVATPRTSQGNVQPPFLSKRTHG